MRPFLLFIFCVSNPLWALTVTPSSVLSSLAEADLVADIEVSEVSYAPHETHQIVWTATAQIDSLLKGSARTDVLMIEGVGGEYDGLGLIYDGFPKPYPQTRYRAYLKQKSNGHYRIVGFDSGLVSLAPSKRAFSRNRTDGSDGLGSGPFLHWNPDYFPIPYFISKNTFSGRPDFVQAITTSFLTWTLIDDTIVDFLGFGCTSNSTNENDGINTVILIDKDWPFETSVIAITRNFFVAGTSPDSGLILDSDILMNAVDHQFGTEQEANKHDVQNILTHEIGHVLGLGHEVANASSGPNNQATMFAQASVGELLKRTPKENDIAGLKEGYFGAVDKVGRQSIECNVNSGPVGCASVHESSESANNWFFCFLLFVVGAVLAERIARRVKAT